MDNFKNFAKVNLSLGYDNTALSIVLAGGEGAKLPAVPFNGVWFNATDFPDPSDDPNVEVVRVTAIATDTLTITRAQEGTAAANHNTSGKTYKLIAALTAKTINGEIFPADFDGTNNGAASAPLIYGWPVIAGAQMKSGFLAASANGNNDLYTCPAGKRALVFGYFVSNNSGGSLNFFSTAKIGGAYFPISPTTGSAGAFVLAPHPFVLEAGEIGGINASGVNASLWLFVMEFPAAVPLKTLRLTPAAGANTLYTVPAGKSARVLFGAPTSTAPAFVSGQLLFFNNSGANRTYKVHVVPSGGSPADGSGGNQINATAGSVFTSGATAISQVGTPPFLASGSFVNVNDDANTATQLIWMTVWEH